MYLVNILYLISELKSIVKYGNEVIFLVYEKYVELRDSRGISDYRVSEDTGITKSTFSDW